MVRISIRETLLFTAMTVLAVASLKFASDGWLALVASLAAVLFWAAVITAILHRGAPQAFAIGFAIVVASYSYLVIHSAMGTQVESNPEFAFGTGRFPTTRMLRSLYQVVEDGYWRDRETGEVLPHFDPAKQPQRLKIVGNQAVPIDEFVERPPEGTFIRVGHLWWTLVLGYSGGVFARAVHSRRMKDATDAHPR